MAEEKVLPEGEELKETPEDISADDPVDDNLKNGEEVITLKKTDYDKILEERDNYKTGLLAEKDKNKKGKKDNPIETPDESKFVKKSDFYKANEKQAISNITAKYPEINDNWDDVVRFVKADDRTSVAAIEESILDGYAVFERRKSKKVPDENKDKKAELAVDAGLGGKKSGAIAKEKKKLFSKAGPIDTWYAKK